MTGRQRLLAAMRGEAVDRVPVWLREGFPVRHGPAGADDFENGWQAEPLYRGLFDYVRPHADDWLNWGGLPQNRFLMIPPRAMRGETIEATPEFRRRRTIVETPRGPLTAVTEVRRHTATTWTVKPLVEDRRELRMLADVPWELDAEAVARARAHYRRALAEAGDRAPLMTDLSSPIVIISGAMALETFLELSLTERAWFHELLEEITRRNLAMLEALWADGPLDTCVNIGGSEQCTPPMMAPEAYDEYVVPYEGRLIAWLKARGVPVKVHCHGKVRRALACMVAEGADATDPVEPPPQGDVTYAEARAVVGDRLTLIGNLQYADLCHRRPTDIREQVREMLAMGTRRLILGASAGPMGPITPRMAENYRAWIDAAREFGGG